MLGPLYSGAAVGNDGSATANQSTANVIEGRIVAVGIKYLDSPPAGTTDVTIATAGNNGPAQTILAISNAATNAWFYPRVATVSTAGAALLYAAGGTAVSDLLAVNDNIKVTIAQANANDGAEVWLLME
jgi:hypothetical protein